MYACRGAQSWWGGRLACVGDSLATYVTQCPYKWRGTDLENLGAQIQSILASQVFSESLTAPSSAFDHNFIMLFEQIAWEVSGMLQSSANPNARNITGTAYRTELYMRVRWRWLLLPGLTVFASIATLCFTIRDSNRRLYLFKNKILTATAFELYDQGAEEYDTDAAWE